MLPGVADQVGDARLDLAEAEPVAVGEEDVGLDRIKHDKPFRPVRESHHTRDRLGFTPRHPRRPRRRS